MSPSELLTTVGLTPPPPTENGSQTILTQESIIEKLKRGNGDSEIAYRDYVLSSSLVAREVGLRPGQQALIVNGRVNPTFREERSLCGLISSLDCWAVLYG